VNSPLIRIKCLKKRRPLLKKCDGAREDGNRMRPRGKKGIIKVKHRCNRFKEEQEVSAHAKKISCGRRH